MRGWNLLYILFVIALFLPVALIPQFQLILNLHLYNTQAGLHPAVPGQSRSACSSWSATSGRSRASSTRRSPSTAAATSATSCRIIVPLTKPAIATVAILHAIGIWNELVLRHHLPDAARPTTRSPAGSSCSPGIYGNDWPLLAAAVLMLALPMVVLFLFLQRYIIGGFTAGSLRG